MKREKEKLGFLDFGLGICMNCESGLLWVENGRVVLFVALEWGLGSDQPGVVQYPPHAWSTSTHVDDHAVTQHPRGHPRGHPTSTWSPTWSDIGG